MIVSITVKCDYPGCSATKSADYMYRELKSTGWKIEKADGRMSMFLCPDHKRKSWDDVRAAQFSKQAGEAHHTP